MNTNILLVGHASSDLGLGHLSRLLSLAQEMMKDELLQPEILIFGEPIEREEFRDIKSNFLPLAQEFVGSVKNFVKKSHPDVVVFDLHPTRLPEDLGVLFEWLKKREIALVGIDSLVDYYQVLDLVWVPSFHFDSSKISSLSGKFKSGWDGFLLQKRLPNQRWKPGEHVLILTGGSDATNLGRTLPSQLDEIINEEAIIHWVQGPYAAPPTLPNKARLKWIIHDAPTQLDELIVHSNYVLTVFGVSFFEVLQYGIPTVVFSPYGNKDNQELIALTEEKIAVVARSSTTAVLKLKKLMGDHVLAKLCSQKAMEKLSVSGVKKLSQAVSSLAGV